jgi:hypothetical protein
MHLHRTSILIACGLVGACTPLPTTAAPPMAPEAAAPEAAAANQAADPTAFGIGGGEADPHTHVWYQAPAALVSARVRVAVDRVAPVGLNFFALQVDFSNGTWAHGGLQDVDQGGARARVVNWGGLVDHGGGTDDYDKEDDLADLDKIQNPPAAQHLGPYPWQDGVTYELAIARGRQVTLPPGDYQLIPDRPVVHVDHPRMMWQWRFTITPVGTDGAPFEAVLYDAADTFNAFAVWNEAGYGSTADMQHARWSSALAGEPGATPQPPTGWSRD